MDIRDLYSEFKSLVSKNDEDKKETIYKLQNIYDCAKGQQKALEKIREEFSKSQPWLSKTIADYYFNLDLDVSEWLKYKKHPAVSASETVKKIATEKREIMHNLKQAEYKINYYESMFPWIVEYLDIEAEEVEDIYHRTDALNDEDKDSVLDYISMVEYKNLSTVERNQLALDRYLGRKHSKQHIGKMYERFVGFLYEKKGYKVEYKGIIDGFDDLGRDIIAKKGKEILIVQCKYWSKHKEIKEAHINQLFGTKTKYFIDLKKEIGEKIKEYNIKAVMIAGTVLSPVAKDFSEALNIIYVENFKLVNYPMIKCNINNKNKIYHLPFDQQYDRVVIEKDKGELYVKTVKEAEDLGFRRAKKWIVNLNK